MAQLHSSPLSSAAEADCAREPIHIPGGIQPHGFLFSVAADGTLLQVSANIATLTGSSAESALGRPIAHVLGDEWSARIISGLASHEAEGVPLYIGSMGDPRGDTSGAPIGPFAVVVHRYQGVLFVELEPALGTEDVFSSMYPLVRTFINRLEEANSVPRLAQLAADEVRRITGYGRTLVYNFDEAGVGHVIAENIQPGYASYIDQHFPGSDIPAQARELYVRNRIRLIADAAYQASPLVPSLHPSTGRPTDLTYASLRSVSPVHVQYMKNMDTLSSMSMSIVVRGKLWGLISCHHASGRVPPFEVRMACEHIAQVLSLQIESKEDHAQAEYRLKLRRTLTRLLGVMADADSFTETLASDPTDLLALTAADGAAIVFDGRIQLIGAAPSEEEVGKLVEWLDSKSEETFATDALGFTCPVLPANPNYAGLLAISISTLFKNYVLWFRKEAIQTIKWAGDPREKLANLAPSLSPRQSFEVWTDTVRDRSLAWSPAEVEIAADFRTALLGIVLRRAEELAQLAQELGRANEELEGFSYTVSHDLRAPLRHIASFADLLRQMENDALSERGQHFLERIISSAKFGGELVDDLLAFSQMSRAALRPQLVDVNALVESLIADEAKHTAHRNIEWHVGDLGEVTADATLIHIVLRNLIENAVKFTATRDVAIIHIGRYAGTDQLADQEVFFVKDNGVGFDMLYVDKLFEVFQRLHRMEEFGGTGIGLASVKRIVERHGGKAWAEGEVEKGATVSFSLPHSLHVAASQGDESSAISTARSSALLTGKRMRVVPKS
uniref:histidine kinase n=1 Tax=Burkholderia sp. (strain CCGE1003) TaxID=640512 RepID=E1TJN9_BURSG